MLSMNFSIWISDQFFDLMMSLKITYQTMANLQALIGNHLVSA